MSVIKSGTNFIKQGTYIYDDSSYRVIGTPHVQVDGPVIKARQTALSYAEKYRLGILTYPEYLMWQTQIMLGLADTEASEKEADNISAQKDSSGRFWENDSEIRQNVSASDYEQFLVENSIDVSNNASVDIASLLNDTSAADSASPQEEETNLDEVLRSVNKDIKGSDVLTEAEIAALFAAAGN